MQTSKLDIAGRNRFQDQARFSARVTACRSLGFKPAAPSGLTPAHGALQPGSGLPETHASTLDTDSLGAALATQGALIVRELLPPSAIQPLRRAIDEVIKACSWTGAEARDQKRSCYYDPPGLLREVMQGRELGRSRAFHRESGSAMCAEAPAVAEALLTLYESLGLKALIDEHLGEPACLSVKKWVLRKTRLPVHEAGWHQDGAFMGPDISSLNMWIPLTRCGGDTGAPGMDIVPRRLHQVVAAEGAMFDWSVNPQRVEQDFLDTPPVSPVFDPGDALFFDHFLLHRTQYRQHFERPRHAIETWFFGRHSAPQNQVPLAW